MRRKISLYIGEALADLDEQSFILMNYTMEDLSNPAIVKNSFSQQITLKGTANNNRIFGGIYRLDRAVDYNGGDTGAGFNPSKKTPFTIYNELNEILESGYLKLDSIERRGVDIAYKCTLYGGLGSFIYSLSYRNGEKMTLADLDYLGTGNPRELDFVINVGTVQTAWVNLTTGQYPVFDVINFAPAYNGAPNGNFSADKGLVHPGNVGLSGTINDYTTIGNYALVSLSEKKDEWTVKDMRSYLQRPVLSMRAFWNAICRPENNGGYTVDISALDNFPYKNTWLTLPMIPSLGSIKQETGDLSLNRTATGSSGNNIATYSVVGSVPSGTKIVSRICTKFRFAMPSGADSYSTLQMSVSNQSGRTYTSKQTILFAQAVAYSSQNTVLGGSKVKVIGYSGDGETIATKCGYTPTYPGQGYENASIGIVNKVSSGVFEGANDVEFEVECANVSYYRIRVSMYQITTVRTYGAHSESHQDVTGDGSTSTPVLYASFSTSYTATSTSVVDGSNANEVTYTMPGTLRSGATVTKQMLLSTKYTPAEYLISLCKMFGLYIITNEAEKKVTILRRNDFYVNESIDLTDRVDLSRAIPIIPMAFDAKWYDFILEGVGGAFFDEYKDVEGVEYGIQRVDTGFDFDAEHTNLMASVVMKNACAILARSAYFNIITSPASQKIPSPFLDKGNRYTLWNANRETLETDISCPSDLSTVDYYNATYPGYDNGPKVELRGADNSPIDGTNVLLFYTGVQSYEGFKLTDDLDIMDSINNGKPCWILDIDSRSINIPVFSRYRINDAAIMLSLDFGVPRQLDIPGVTYDRNATIYARAWKKYLEDRFSINTKVMTCFVDFRGMAVSHELLRKFYYFDNSWWVLNKIINYSLTTYDPVECEFVQVQDKANYLTGQDY